MRFCLIGCGEHAVSSHGPSRALCAASHPELELAGCCDADAARAEAFRQRFPFARAYDDLDSMLDAVPYQVAFNRRFVPLVTMLRDRVQQLPASAPLQHIRYEIVRVNRRDPDFSTTAIDAIDAVRFITGSDCAEIRFRYQALAGLGDGVANIFMDAVLRSGVTAYLAFCPVAGIVVERAELHARDHTLFVEIPMWGGSDTPGRLVHLERAAVVEDVRGASGADAPAVVLGGFYGEYAAFFGSLAAGRSPQPSLEEVRQSVEVAEAIRARREEWRS